MYSKQHKILYHSENKLICTLCSILVKEFKFDCFKLNMKHKTYYLYERFVSQGSSSASESFSFANTEVRGTGVIHKANLDSTMTMSNMCAQNINRLLFTAAEYH